MTNSGFGNDQGPGQNLSFFLITSGLDLNPANGTIGKTNYSFIKNVISNSSEILFESPSLRSIDNVDISTHLLAYDSMPRTLYQILIGLSSYNNSWNIETLSAAINENAIHPQYWPTAGQYSINPYEAYEKDYGIYECVRIGPTQLVWSKRSNFKISESIPSYSEGTDKAIWAILINNRIEFYIKLAFQWISLEEYVQSNEITITFSDTEPLLVEGALWVKFGDLMVYNFGIDDWNSGIMSRYLPENGFDGDLILDNDRMAISLYQQQGNNRIPCKLSNYIIRNKDLNSTFRLNSNNFIIEDGSIALTGGIATYQFDGDNNVVKVYQDGNFIGNYSGINFQGPTVTDDGESAMVTFSPNQVDVNIEVIPIVVQEENQTIFNAPNDLVDIINLSVNGIDERSFHFSNIDSTIVFNPVSAKYNLEITDTIILTYIKS